MYTDRIKQLLKQYHQIKIRRERHKQIDRNYGSKLEIEKLKLVESKMFGEDEVAQIIKEQAQNQ